MAEALFDNLAAGYDEWYELPLGQAVDYVERKAIEGLFIPAGPRILEIGCGTGQYTGWLAAQGYEVTAVDVSSRMMDKAKERLAAAGKKANWIVGDICDLLDDLDSYDGILSMTAFEFIPQPESVLRALYQNKLQKGGCLVIGVIAENSPWSRKYRQSAALNPQSVFNRARFFSEEEIAQWDVGVEPEIESVLYFPPATKTLVEALTLEKIREERPGFLVARWQK